MATKPFVNPPTDEYVYAYRNIMSASGFVNPHTGETVNLGAERKIIWLQMLDRFYLFKSLGNQWFDNQIDIASACNVGLSTVQRFINDLKSSGYIEVNQTRVGGHLSNSYTLLRDLVLVQPEKGPNKAAQRFSGESDTSAAPPPENGSKELIERYIENNNSAGEEWATESIPYDDAPVMIIDSSEEDDGSIADARNYVEDSPIGNASRPQIRHQSNGKSANEQHAYKTNQTNKRENNGCVLYEIKGELHTLENDQYVPASAIDIALFETGLPF